jgi:hypothetical protein
MKYVVEFDGGFHWYRKGNEEYSTRKDANAAMDACAQSNPCKAYRVAELIEGYTGITEQENPFMRMAAAASQHRGAP